MKSILITCLILLLSIGVYAQRPERVNGNKLGLDVPRTDSFPLEQTFIARSQRHQSAAEAFFSAAFVLAATGIIIGDDLIEPLSYAAGACFLASYSFSLSSGKQRGRAIRLLE